MDRSLPVEDTEIAIENLTNGKAAGADRTVTAADENFLRSAPPNDTEEREAIYF